MRAAARIGLARHVIRQEHETVTFVITSRNLTLVQSCITKQTTYSQSNHSFLSIEAKDRCFVDRTTHSQHSRFVCLISNRNNPRKRKEERVHPPSYRCCRGFKHGVLFTIPFCALLLIGGYASAQRQDQRNHQIPRR